MNSEVQLFNEPPFEIQATTPVHPDAVMGMFAYALWTPERLISIARRHKAPFSEGFVDGVETDILLMLVTEHEWPIVCMRRRIGYVVAIKLGEHYLDAYRWCKDDIYRIKVRLRRPT